MSTRVYTCLTRGYTCLNVSETCLYWVLRLCLEEFMPRNEVFTEVLYPVLVQDTEAKRVYTCLHVFTRVYTWLHVVTRVYTCYTCLRHVRDMSILGFLCVSRGIYASIPGFYRSIVPRVVTRWKLNVHAARSAAT